MTLIEFVTHLTRFVFVALFALTTLAYFRQRTSIRRDIALMFGCLSASILIILIRSLFGLPPTWLAGWGSLILLAQPYLLLRLVGYFRRVPKWVYVVAFSGMLGSVILVLSYGTPMPALPTLLVVAYFAVIDGYAVVAFIQSAFTSAGVTRNRLRFAALGSTMLIIVLTLAGVNVALPDLAPITFPIIQFCSVASALAYYAGFAPPRWLSEMWQLGELRSFLRDIQQQQGDQTSASVLREFYRAVSQTISASTVVVARWEEGAQRLIVSNESAAILPPGFDMNSEMTLHQALAQRKASVIYNAVGISGEETELMRRLKAETLYIVPIATPQRTLGLLKVFLEHGSLFPEDDLDLLQIFAAQTAIVLENYAVLEELTEHAATLENRVQERTYALQQSNEALQQFAYIASHDLQEPLRTVYSYLQLIEMRYVEVLDDDGREFIGFAMDGIERMKAMMTSLLKYSRVQTEPQKFTQVDLQEVLRKVSNDLKAAIEEADATLSFDALPCIYGDAQLLTQLFQNLIGNAIKYRSERKPVVSVGAARDGNQWSFWVRDNGIGIEEAELGKVFEIFKRLNNSTGRSGTGIGLALCKRVIDWHGGRIWAESQVGEGTTFRFTLPV